MTTYAHEFLVAVLIYRCNQRNEPIWYGKIVELLKDKLGKNEISHAMDTLADWMIAYGKYGPTENGRVGYCWYIDDDIEPIIRDMSERMGREKNGLDGAVYGKTE